MARPRNRANRGLPPNLYLHSPSGIYRYRHPQKGTFTYLSKDKSECVVAAKRLNAMLIPTNDLVSKVVAPALTFDQLVNQWTCEDLNQRELADKTRTIYRTAADRLIRTFGRQEVTEITVRDLAAGLEDLTDGRRMRNQYRSLLIQIFQFARAEGWRDDNPADALRKAREKRERERLTVLGFRAIYKQAPPWLRTAMRVALYSLQREGDVLSMEYSRSGVWRFEQEKTGTPLEIEVIGGLARAVDRSRRDNVVSPFVVHRLPQRAKPRAQQSKHRTHHTQVLKQTLIHEFAAARQRSRYYAESISPPTFHEIRSLGAHLMREAGHDERMIQLLLGHQDIEQTRVYLADHDRAHVRVTAATF